MDWQKILDFGMPKGSLDISFGLAEKIDSTITTWLMDQIAQITTLFFKLILDVPLQFFETKNFQQLYFLSSAIVWSIATPIVIYHGLKLIVGKITIYNMGKHLLRLAICPFAVWIAPTIIQYVLLVVNKICRILLDIPSQNVFIKPESVGIGTLVFVGIMLYYLFKLSIYYAGRNVLIIFLVVVFPLIFLLSCMPSKFDKLDKFVSELSALIITQFIHVIQLLILFALTEVQSDNLVEITLRIGALWIMLNAPNWLEGYLNTNIKGMSDIDINREIQFAKKTVGYITDPTKAIKGVFNVFKS